MKDAEAKAVEVTAKLKAADAKIQAQKHEIEVLKAAVAAAAADKTTPDSIQVTAEKGKPKGEFIVEPTPGKGFDVGNDTHKFDGSRANASAEKVSTTSDGLTVEKVDETEPNGFAVSRGTNAPADKVAADKIANDMRIAAEAKAQADKDAADATAAAQKVFKEKHNAAKAKAKADEAAAKAEDSTPDSKLVVDAADEASSNKKQKPGSIFSKKVATDKREEEVKVFSDKASEEKTNPDTAKEGITSKTADDNTPNGFKTITGGGRGELGEAAIQCKGKWGFMTNHADWKEGEWSRSIAINLAENSQHSEQYQVSPPNCPETCKKRSSSHAKQDSKCVESSAKHQTDIKVDAGLDNTCALTQGGKLSCWGNDERHKTSGWENALDKMVFSSVAVGKAHTCALNITGSLFCWGAGSKADWHMSSVRSRAKKWKQIASGDTHSCGISDSNALSCWGVGKGAATLGDGFEFMKWSMVAAGNDFNCGITFAGELKCWIDGKLNSDDKRTKMPKGSEPWASVSCGSSHCCGIREVSKSIECWGDDSWMQVSGILKGHKWLSVACGGGLYADEFLSPFANTCGITEANELHCWGSESPRNSGQMRLQMRVASLKSDEDDFPADFAAAGVQIPEGSKWSSVSVGGGHICAVSQGTHNQKVRCWANCFQHMGLLGNDYQQLAVPDERVMKWTQEPSCLTSHPLLSGPASCTSCDPESCNKHFTLMDPKTNTGTCSKTSCPSCKPKSCCEENHKHYVVNAENLEGVCVRHSDDCTPVCVPNEDGVGNQRRVCTKGCNRMLKVRDTSANGNSAFKIVVCQADKRVVCEPGSNNAQVCTSKATFMAVAKCKFTSDLWNLGATCIANHVLGDKHPQCPFSANVNHIRTITGETPIFSHDYHGVKSEGLQVVPEGWGGFLERPRASICTAFASTQQVEEIGQSQGLCEASAEADDHLCQRLGMTF